MNSSTLSSSSASSISPGGLVAASLNRIEASSIAARAILTFEGALPPFVGRHAGVDQRQFDIVQGVGTSQQIKALEDKPNLLVADLSELADETEKILPIVEASADTNSYLALLGDKRFIFSESGRSFIMYGVQGRTWVAMGDVIGDVDETEDLVWKFRGHGNLTCK